MMNPWSSWLMGASAQLKEEPLPHYVFLCPCISELDGQASFRAARGDCSELCLG